jgi:hypothetical protein
MVVAPPLAVARARIRLRGWDFEEHAKSSGDRFAKAWGRHGTNTGTQSLLDTYLAESPMLGFVNDKRDSFSDEINVNLDLVRAKSINATETAVC